MKTRTFSSLLVCVSLLFGLLAAPARAAAEAGKSFGWVPVPGGLSLADVKEAIVVSLVQRSWTVAEKTDTKIIGTLKHRSFDTIITITYAANSVEIYCEGWKIDKAGTRIKPDIPDGWAENIKKDITKRMSLMAARK